MFVSLSARQRRAKNPQQAGPVYLEIALKCFQQHFRLHAGRNMGMPVVKPVLPVRIGQGALCFVENQSSGFQFPVERGTGKWHVKHELVEVRVVANGVVNGFIDIFRSVVFQADDGGSQHADAVRLKLPDHFHRIHAMKLSIPAALTLQSDPDPGNTQRDQLLHCVGTDRIGRAEYIKNPGLIVLLHQFQQPERPLAIEEEIFIHHKKGLRAAQ
ncbi:MAG: hypothetical protein BWY71_02303 [Planctomycetes bacterium ADurb.Bin412]|nr:MAG: hypothetical protein BWY71_02303 [Planctomycetes bacterium ADurb.Bin412]